VNEQVLALMPLLVTTATVVGSMFVIAVRRDHDLTGGVTIVGMNLALLSVLVSWIATDGHAIAVTGLMLVDSTAQFAMVLVLVTTLGVLTLCPAYFNGYRGHREELYLLLGVGTLGALTLACASHAATLLLGLELLSLPMVGAVASTLGLLATGGSDYHGDLMPYAEAHESLNVPASVADELRARLAG